jgi:hypothetical protein
VVRGEFTASPSNGYDGGAERHCRERAISFVDTARAFPIVTTLSGGPASTGTTYPSAKITGATTSS